MGLTAVRDQYPGRLSVDGSPRSPCPRLRGSARPAADGRAFRVAGRADGATAARTLLDVWHARQTTVLFVTHNLREAIQLADRLVLLPSAPTRVLADLPIDLPRAMRDDEAAVEAFRAELLSRAGPAFRLLG